MATHTDPICGMQIDESQATGQSEFEGTKYFFCSKSCKEKFDASPESFAGKAEVQP